MLTLNVAVVVISMVVIKPRECTRERELTDSRGYLLRSVQCRLSYACLLDGHLHVCVFALNGKRLKRIIIMFESIWLRHRQRNKNSEDVFDFLRV